MPVLSRTVTIAIAAALASPGSAAADSKDDQARVLFERARTLVKAGDFEHACPLFEESERLVPALGTELNLAQCWTEVGKLVAARKLYEQVLEGATKANQRARIDLANDGLTLLAKRTPRLEFVITGGTAKVTVDDEAVDPATPLAVDPGSHKIVAIGPDDRRIEVSVDTKADGATSKVPIDFAASKPPDQPPPMKYAPVAPAPSDHRFRRRASWAMIISGGASLASGAVFGGLARTKRDSAIDQCIVEGDTATCPVAAGRRLRKAGIYGDVSTLSVIAGIALGGVGITLLATTPSERSTQVRAQATAHGGQLVIEGTW